MIVTSTRKVILLQDRDGSVEEFLQIHISVRQKDDVNKKYIIDTKDFMVLNKGTGNPILSSVKNRYGENQEKAYHKTYEEYDGEKAQLSQMFPSDLTGSELDDYLLLCGLLYSLQVEPIYGLLGSEWVAGNGDTPVEENPEENPEV